MLATHGQYSTAAGKGESNGQMDLVYGLYAWYWVPHLPLPALSHTHTLSRTHTHTHTHSVPSSPALSPHVYTHPNKLTAPSSTSSASACPKTPPPSLPSSARGHTPPLTPLSWRSVFR